MDVFQLSQAQYNSTLIDTQGKTYSGPVLLSSIPTQPLEAVPKQYVDTTIAAHATNMSVHLASNEKTLISNITATAAEINRLAGSTTNIQTQINTKLNYTGGTMTGALTLFADPVSSDQLATKNYIDALVGSKFNIQTGDIILKPYSATPAGFLKCNGAYILQTTYSTLFNKVNHNYENNINVTLNYTSYSVLGNGKPWKHQYDISQNANYINGFVDSGLTLSSGFSGINVVVTKNRVYFIGGNYAATGPSNTIYSAPISTDGTVGAFTIDSNTLPNALYESEVIVTKNKVHLIGGYNAGASLAVYTATINSDGTLGAFTNTGTLLRSVYAFGTVVTKNRVYLLGGWDGSAASYNFIQTAPINSDGTLGTFTIDSNVLPVNSAFASTIVTKNRAYILGGRNGTSNVNTVYTATINSDGTLGVFTNTGATLPSTMVWSESVVTQNYVYLYGGRDQSNNYLSGIYAAPINTDGTLGAWSTVGTLTSAKSSLTSFVTRNHIYLVGGFNTNGLINKIEYATVNTIGLNDYRQCYNGNVNLFDGTNLTGTYLLFTNNPDINTYFGLPDSSIVDALTPNNYRFIKY